MNDPLRSTETQICEWCKREFYPLKYYPGKCCNRQCAGLLRRSQPAVDRFWPKVKTGTKDECWPWQGSLNQDGYGHFWYGGKLVTAHRVSWELTYGAVPPGLDVLHKCDNRPCCNPAHYFLGTHGDNCRDRTKKGRTAKGEAHGKVKLTEVQAKEILQASKTGSTRQQLADSYGVSKSAISHIIKGRNWSHLQR